MEAASMHVLVCEILVCVLRRGLWASAPCGRQTVVPGRTRGSDSPAGSCRDVTWHQFHADLPTGRLPPSAYRTRSRSPSSVCRIFLPRWCPRGGMAGSP